MRIVFVVVCILSGLVSPAMAQEAQGTQEFLQRAREATAKYQDQAIAVLDGYRPIGRDFPAMGEHWIRIDLLFDGKIEAEHPEFLTYVSVSGSPTLMGLAYALPLLAGESPPSSPAAPEAWHDHLSTLEEETVSAHHHHSANAADTARLSMLHAWIWSANPDGVFAADNWAIPYLRLGIPVPPRPAIPAAAALSLLNGGIDYFSKLIDAAVAPNQPNKKEQVAIRAAFSRTQSAVEADVRAANFEKLAGEWSSLRRSLEMALNSRSRAQFRSVFP